MITDTPKTKTEYCFGEGRKKRIDELCTNYRFAFYILGNQGSTQNLLKVASFVSNKKPSKYEALRLDFETTIIFWNP